MAEKYTDPKHCNSTELQILEESSSPVQSSEHVQPLSCYSLDILGFNAMGGLRFRFLYNILKASVDLKNLTNFGFGFTDYLIG